MDEVRKLLSQANELDPEEFCTRAFVLTSERGVINKNVPLGTRYQLAYEFLQTILKNPKSYAGGQTPDVDYYELLGVDESATQEEIEEAYKQRKESLKPETLEKKLRAQGLSENEINERLSKAKNTLFYVENAQIVLGNEIKRDHYDEHLRSKRRSEWEETLDRKERKAVRRKTAVVNHGENWNILNVTPNPTQLELRTAYLTYVRISNPELYLKQLNKSEEELTLEEQKEYNITKERWSNLNRAYAEELDEKTLKDERKELKLKLKIKQKSFTKEQFNILININPTTPKTETSDKELWKAKDFYNTVNQAGTVEYSAEEVLEMKNEGLIPNEMTVEEVNHRAELALDLHSRGIKATDFSQALDKAKSEKILTEDENMSLQFSAFLMESLETENPERAKSLRIGNQEPTISLSKTPTTNITPQPNQLILQGDGQGFLKPILKQSFEIIKDKAGNVVKKALEKIGLSGAKTAVKKFATEALKKAGKQLLKLGTKIAAKAGIQAIASLAPGVGNAIAFFVTDVLPRLLKPVLKHIKKALSSILRFITGKDDLKSQLKELSGVALVGSLVMGAAIPAIISGGIFFSTIGVGSIIGGIGAITSVVFFVITSAIMAVSVPILVSIFVFVVLVIFITFIINNSAYVVPYGLITDFLVHVPENEYINVSKEASSDGHPANSYQTYTNDEFNITVTYTITVTALEEDITITDIDYDCTVNNLTTDLECPEQVGWDPLPESIVVTPSEPYVFNYTQTYTSDYADSLITDIITVEAFLESETLEVVSDSDNASICIGDCPVDCPYGWPTEHGYITQGSDTPEPYSHSDNDAAIDIGVRDLTPQPMPVRSTHAGTVRAYYSAGGGNTVEIRSNCNGIEFRSVYMHMGVEPNDYDDYVSTGDPITRGVVIGIVGNTGENSEGTHLHYEFVDNIPWPEGMLMEYDLIPEDIQPSPDCCSVCGSYRPLCTNSW